MNIDGKQEDLDALWDDFANDKRLSLAEEFILKRRVDLTEGIRILRFGLALGYLFGKNGKWPEKRD